MNTTKLLNLFGNGRKRTLLTALATISVASLAHGATLGLNFTDGWPTPMLAGETADGFSNWTDSVDNYGAAAPNDVRYLGTVFLTGSSGVYATWHAANTWSAGSESVSERQLYRLYLDDGDGGSSLVAGDGIGVSVTITNLAAWLSENGSQHYAIRCYASTDTGTATFLPVQIRQGIPDPVNGVTQLTSLPILESVNIPTLGAGNFPTATGGSGSRGYGDSGILAEDTITLTIQAKSGTPRGTLAGIKIYTAEPAISVEPQSPATNVYLGKPFSLAVSAEGLMPLSYQWWQGGTAVEGATAATYSVTNAALTDSGSYKVVVTNLAGAVTSAPVAVTVVTRGPILTSQPVSGTRYIGGYAAFDPGVDGSPPFAYQWKHAGTNLPGATLRQLYVPNLTETEAGGYQLFINNDYGNASSDLATITLIPVTLGGYEEAIVASHPIGFWRFNEAEGSLVAYDYYGGNTAMHTNVLTGVASPQSPEFLGMETTNAAAQYAGFSTATATSVSLLNNLGQFSSIGWFNASGQLQSSRAGLFGQNDVCEFGFHGGTTLETQTVGAWTPQGGAYLSVTNITPYQWYLIAAVGNGTNVTLYLVSTNNGGTVQQATSTPNVTTNYGSSAYPFRIGGGGILDTTGNFFTGLIDEVAFYDRALTASELASLLGTALVGGALPPKISIEPKDQTTLYAGRTFTLYTEAVGEDLHYQWRKGGAPISDNGALSGTTTKTLTITAVTAGDAGDFDLVVTNTAGAATSRVAVLSVIPLVPDSYEALVVAGNPIAYYRLNELEDPFTTMDGVVAHDYVGGYNGVYGVAALNGYNNIAGPRPPAWLFETSNAALQSTVGTADSWVSASFGTLGINTVTFTMWINPTGLQEAWSGLLMSRGATAGGLGYNGDQMLAYTWNSDSTWSWVSGLVPPTNRWSFVAMVVEPTQTTVYLGDTSGLKSAVNAVAHASDVFGTWQIGHDNQAGDATRTFNGIIDEVAVYTHSLSPSEIADLFVAGGGVAPVVPTTLSIQRVGEDVVISWPTGTLLEADEVTGPWTTNNASSPFTPASLDARKFYRVIQK